MTIVILKNPRSQYSVLNHMEEELRRAFIRKGYDSSLCEVSPREFEKIFSQMSQDKVFCTCSINLSVEPSFFYDTYRVPHLFISVDAPFWHSMKLLSAQHVVACFPDVESQKYAKAAYGKPTICLQHACFLQPLLQPDQKRDIPFFFPATYIDDEAAFTHIKTQVGTRNALVISDEVENFLEDVNASYFSFSKRVADTFGVGDIQSFVQALDIYVRGKERERLFLSLVGQKVHVATNKHSFDQYRNRFPEVDFVYEGERSFSDLFLLFPRVHTLIHSCPTLRNGLHERVLYGLSFGCSLYSTSLHVLPSWIRTSGVVSFYDQKDPFPILPDQKAFLKIRKWLESEHSWDARVEQLTLEAWPIVKKIRSL